MQELICLDKVMNGLEKLQLLTNAVTTGDGGTFGTERSKGWTFVIESASVTSGATVNIEAWIGGAWRVVHPETVTADGSVMVRDDLGQYEKLRANISAYTDGTYNVYATGSVESL